jgi:hypothetical protein
MAWVCKELNLKPTLEIPGYQEEKRLSGLHCVDISATLAHAFYLALNMGK